MRPGILGAGELSRTVRSCKVPSRVVSIVRSAAHLSIPLCCGANYETRPDMADTLTPAERSHRMSLIKSRDTKPELAIRRALHAVGYRYRIHVAKLAGRPDIVFGPRRVVVFVNGCFWHGHRCATGHIPKSNSAFWQRKIDANRNRDSRHIRQLRTSGWKVVIVWECEVKQKGGVEREVARIGALLSRRQTRKAGGHDNKGNT
jgi:DNA mismatch endonuclease (patch repair protein)